jgi:hypothetical protein
MRKQGIFRILRDRAKACKGYPELSGLADFANPMNAGYAHSKRLPERKVREMN